MTRIVVISDTHGRHNELMIPDGDILVHCGDFCTHGQYLDATRFLHWFQTHPHQQKIFIAGNHDLVFEQGSYHDIAMLTEFHLNDSTHYLNDSGINLFGINFWGSPVQPRFFNWAFNRDRGADIKKHWDKIPKGTDVLITHGPPYRICDAAPRGYGLYDQVGCDELLKKVKKIKPSIHLFGHIHFCGGQQVQEEHTLFVNCSICDERYVATNKPFVFDIDKDKNISIVNVT